MQCCPKSIKTKLHKSFSYAMLPGASQITLHRILTCSLLLEEYKDNVAEDFFL